MALLPLLLAAPILVWIAWTDFRYMRIRNTAVLAALAVFVLTAPLIGWHEAGLRLLAAVAVFAVAFVLFAVRMVGGGDVKMGAALVLFVPSGAYALFGLVFSASILITLALVVGLRTIPALRRSGPVSLRAKGTFPMGMAFGLSAVLLLAVLVPHAI